MRVVEGHVAVGADQLIFARRGDAAVELVGDVS
jgi:hypothetical protein